MESLNNLLPLLPIALALVAFALHYYWRRWRHARLLNTPLPALWVTYLEQRLPVYTRLSAQQRNHLHQMIHLFLDDKTFYGCAGLLVTDEMRVCIAAQACLLCLGRQGPLYPGLQAILVYPAAFLVARESFQEDGTVADEAHALLGESWDSGRVILSWDDVARGASDFTDGHNVVLHEFAHQLDSASGATNGAPALRRNDHRGSSHTSYQTWAMVFSENFNDLRERAQQGKPTVMDTYGASNEAEFFAVATETFFEKPLELQAKRPELFEQLLHYYQLDPRQWHPDNAPH